MAEVTSEAKEEIALACKAWRKRILFTVWITYASFYLTRVNMSVALPGIMDEFGYSKTIMGGVLSALFAAYTIGQFINGQLGDKFGARKMVSLGLVVSGVINLIFGHSGLLTSMMLLWGLNGYFQSMGWSPSVKTVANWFPPSIRGRATGLMGSSYQVGNAASWALAGLIVGLLGWRWAFWIPGILVIVAAIHFYIRARNAPEEVGLPCLEEQENPQATGPGVTKDEHLGFAYTIRTVLGVREIWVVGFAMAALSVVRYGFMDWAVTYMVQVQKAHISTAAFKSLAIPLAGSLGAVVAGWMSDRLFGHRRAPIAVIFLLLLALSTWLFPRVPAENWLGSFAMLLAIGFFTYGPHVLMVTTLPMELAGRKATASATGFIDGWAYIGAILTGIGSGWLIDHHGWGAAFNAWLIAGLFSAGILALLWRYRPPPRPYL